MLICTKEQLKHMKYTVFLFLWATQLFFAQNIALHNNIQIIDNTNSKAISYAKEALESDFQLKFGTTVSKLPTIQITLKIDRSLSDFDTYEIELQKQKIVFKGSDELGLLHAIYTFSETYLDIDPFIYFTEIAPKIEDVIYVKSTLLKSTPYTFKHRIFFINDEDLIVGFQREHIAHGFHLGVMEKIYEAMLRLKMTGVIPSTLILSDEPHLKLASDMGLFIAQHHAEPVGSVPLFWPKNIPYSWSTHKEHFIDFWKKAIERQKGKNVIWTLNFRGLLDRAFWEDDPTITDKSTDKEKASIINDVLQTQYDLIAKTTQNKQPLTCGYLWGELGGLYRKGLINYPKNTIILAADQGYATFAKGTFTTFAKTKQPKGIYQHVSYHNRKTHLRINTIHPDVIDREMQKAIQNNLTDMMVLNVGNIKEKIFGIQQMVNYMNSGTAFTKQKNSANYFEYYTKHKLHTNSKAVSKSYKDFFSNQFDLGNKERKPGDESYFYYVEKLLNMAYEKEIIPSFFKHEFPGDKQQEFEQIKGTKPKLLFALDQYEQLYKKYHTQWHNSMLQNLNSKKELTGSEASFYKVDLVLPTQKMHALTGMSLHFTTSLKHYLNKNYHESELSAFTALEYAKKAVSIEKQIEQNNFGKFNNWYQNDATALTWKIPLVLNNYLNHIKDLKYFNLPYASRNSKTPGLQYKQQPYFKSNYQKELIFLENAH